MGCWWFDESPYPGPPEESTFQWKTFIQSLAGAYGKGAARSRWGASFNLVLSDELSGPMYDIKNAMDDLVIHGDLKPAKKPKPWAGDCNVQHGPAKHRWPRLPRNI